MTTNSGLWIGNLAVSPEASLTAGDYGTWTLSYTVGRYGIDIGGRLRLLFRYAWDGGVWQASDPEADNYVTVRSTRPEVCFRQFWDARGGRRPWLKAWIIEVADEPLAEGDHVIVTLGDTQGGSRGHRTQTFVESEFCWLMDIEAFESGTWTEVPGCPKTSIIAGPPDHLVLVTPSQVEVAEQFSAHLRCVDRFGNTADRYRGTVLIEVENCSSIRNVGFSGSASLVFDSERQGLARIDGLSFSEAGVVRLVARDQEGQVAWSNPIRVSNVPNQLRHCWGDLHAQYKNALGTGSVREAMLFARDAAGIAFVGHQPNDFQFSTADWDEVRAVLPEIYEPGRFVPFLGYEWSGNTPAGGDRNVHFLGADGPLHRSSHWQLQNKRDAADDRYPLSELYKEFSARDDVLMIPHVGGRRSDITRYYHPRLEPVIEICSCHGRFEWLLREALSNGYVVGVVGGSDDHTGRPGAASATDHSFGTRGGMTGIFVRELTRSGVFSALRSRHCYATTGERIGLWVETTTGHMMGDTCRLTQDLRLKVEITATSPLESVEIFRNLDLAYSLPIFEAASAHRVRLQWSGARVKGRGRHSNWSGGIRIENGSILDVRAIAFDHPRQGITSWDETRVQWSSTTSGDYDAVEIVISRPEWARIHVETPLTSFAFAVSELKAGPILKLCGGVEQQFLARLAHSTDGPRTAEFEWADSVPLQERNAYWVKVTQSDGEMAWSSPIYVQAD